MEYKRKMEDLEKSHQVGRKGGSGRWRAGLTSLPHPHYVFVN